MGKIRDRLPSSRKIVSFIGICIAIAFVVIAIQNILGVDSMESRAKKVGYRPVIVVTGSMVPAIEVNSVSLMEYCTIDDLEVGDILMYRDPNRNINITHRVINVEKDWTGKVLYVNTKGDANVSQDSLNITSELVIGKLVKTYNWIAPYLSKFMIEPGEINSTAVMQAFLSLAVAIVLTVIVGYNLVIILISLLIAGRSPEYFEKYLETFETDINSSKDNLERLKELTSSNDIRTKLARARAVREIKAFNESSKDFNRAMKIVKYLTKK